MFHPTTDFLKNRYSIGRITNSIHRHFRGWSFFGKFSSPPKSAIAFVLILSQCLFNTGCDTPEGARTVATFAGAGTGAAAGFLAGGRRNGVFGAITGAFVGATIANRYGSGLFMSRKLRFEEDVIKGDVQNARRNFDPAYVNAKFKGYPPIFYAAIRGDDEMVSFLIREGASLSYRANGNSLAFVAASYGHRETGRILASHGGGSISDADAGDELYAENSERQRQQERVMDTAAIAFLATAISQEESSSQGGDSFEEDAADFHHNAEVQQSQGIENNSVY
jgi:hypothetical protein